MTMPYIHFKCERPSNLVLVTRASWSWGGNQIDTYTDASYIQFLGGQCGPPPHTVSVFPCPLTELQANLS